MNSKSKIRIARTWLAATGLALLPAAGAWAQDAAALRAHSLASTCVACHGTQGRPVTNNSVPGLAGMPADYLVEQMKAFQNGTRTATVMHQIAKGYDDAQIRQLAVFFSTQVKTGGAR